MKPRNPFLDIPPFDKDSDELNVIVDTPKGSRNKYEFDDTTGLFKLGGVLALGHSFPYDFGFVPNTLAGDGDAVDVLILMDEPAFPGCLVKCRLLGGIEVRQTEKDAGSLRNDRLLATASKSLAYARVKSIKDLASELLEQIEHFFISYNEVKGKLFEPLGRFGVIKARTLIEKSHLKRRPK